MSKETRSGAGGNASQSGNHGEAGNGPKNGRSLNSPTDNPQLFPARGITYRGQMVIGYPGRYRVRVQYDAPKNGNIAAAWFFYDRKRIDLIRLSDGRWLVRPENGKQKR